MRSINANRFSFSFVFCDRYWSLKAFGHETRRSTSFEYHVCALEITNKLAFGCFVPKHWPLLVETCYNALILEGFLRNSIDSLKNCRKFLAQSSVLYVLECSRVIFYVYTHFAWKRKSKIAEIDEWKLAVVQIP